MMNSGLSILDCFLSIKTPRSVDQQRFNKSRGHHIGGLSNADRATQHGVDGLACSTAITVARSEEHTSELQSQSNLVCRLLLEKKKEMSRHFVKSPSTICMPPCLRA